MVPNDAVSTFWWDGPFDLEPGLSIVPEMCVNRPNRPGYDLVMQRDGNLVLLALPDGYAHPEQNVPVWSSGTSGHPGAYLVAQSDGNMAIYSGHYQGQQILWQSGTAGCYGEALAVQDPRTKRPLRPLLVGGLGVFSYEYPWSGDSTCNRVLFTFG